jgi:hypothetical protein
MLGKAFGAETAIWMPPYMNDLASPTNRGFLASAPLHAAYYLAPQVSDTPFGEQQEHCALHPAVIRCHFMLPALQAYHMHVVLAVLSKPIKALGQVAGKAV